MHECVADGDVEGTIVNCLLCDGTMVPWVSMPIDPKKDAETSFCDVFRCERCETGTVMPKPRLGEIADFYALPKYYTQGESHIQPVDSGLADRILVRLAWALDDARPFGASEIAELLPKDAKILDLGCGSADILAGLSALGYAGQGVDPDPVARRQAAARGVEVLEGTSEHLPSGLPSGSYDFVLMTHSLEHTVDPLKAVDNAADLLKAGGLMYIEVPNCGCLHFQTLLSCSENFDSPRHLWFFSKKGLTRLAEKSGFDVMDWRYHGFTRHHSPAWRAWEKTIYRQLAKRGLERGRTKHSFGVSARLFAKSAFASFDRKYDAIGVLLRKN